MPSTTDDRIRRAWAILSPPTTNFYNSYALPAPSGESVTRLAVDKAGKRHLLVPTREKLDVSSGASSVLLLTAPTLGFGGPILDYLDVQCDDPELNPEFDELLADVLDSFSSETTDHGAAALLVINRWRRLFRTGGRRGLSLEGQFGLFAELQILRALQNRDTHAHLEWTGPERLPHDFELPTWSLEVKGIGATADHIIVHGLDQMAESAGKSLMLALVQVEVNPLGVTIESLIADIDATVAGTSFRQKLSRSGWTGQEPDVRLSAVSTRIVRVDSETPRLVSGDLITGITRPGVDRVSYHVALTDLLPLADEISLEALAAEVAA